MIRSRILAAALGLSTLSRADAQRTAADPTDSLPMRPERTIAFSTSEGSWMALDVSPDGQTIVFELLGDLYTIPVTGGEAKRITAGPPFDTQPRYAPDGKTIVFLPDRSGPENLWPSAADAPHPPPPPNAPSRPYP